MNKPHNKISIIGAGFVGSTIAYSLILSGITSEIVIVDINNEKSIGEVMDLNHGISFVSPVNILSGQYKDIKDSDIIIITAGVNQKPEETRLDLAKRNIDIFKEIVPEIVTYADDAILLVVSNPVDILTYATYKISGFNKNKVIGSGTVLDTSRFKYLLSTHTGIDARNIHTFILGEHGDSEVPIWSATNIAGMSMEQFCSSCSKCSGISKYNIFNDVKNAAYEIIKRKGATYYAVGLAVRRVVECILRNEHSVLTVSSLLEGQYGINDISLSLPCIVGNKGIENIIEISLSEDEILALQSSGMVIKDIIEKIEI